MTELLETLSLPFVQRAILACVFIAAATSCFGVTLVLKKYAFIGEGLSNVAFACTSVASLLSLTNNLYIVLPITILTSILLMIFGQTTKNRSDSVIAVISVCALAFGYLLVYVVGGSNAAAELCSVLFGSASILTLDGLDVWICILMAVLVLVTFVIFYHRIFSVTFDETFMQASGVKSKVYNMLIAIIIAVVISISIRYFGSLLITALLIFPALSSMKLFNSFKMVSIFSIVIGVFSALVGSFCFVAIEFPVGSTIVLVDLIIYIVCIIVGKLLKGRVGR